MSYEKPLPRIQGMTGEYYEFCKKGELRFQKCSGCGSWRHVPREYCAKCGSGEFEWALSSGKGKVYSWSTTYRPMHPSFLETPFAQVVVELEEGPRVMSWVTDVDPEDLKMDMPVKVYFDAVTDEVTLPKFKSA